jgi:tripartite-type tricarboxylate transporter receptor subunit TctC
MIAAQAFRARRIDGPSILQPEEVLMSSITRRLLGALAVGGAALACAPAVAQDFPSKPIRIVVPWPAGGLVDAAARAVGEKLGTSLGQPVIVENRPGAGGNIGADLVAKAAPDGYTLVVTTSALDMNAALQSHLPFDVVKDFDPIAVVATAPSILVVYPGLPVKSVKDLIAYAKSRPGKLTYASAGNGTPAHFAAELFKTMTGIDAIHVPYKGAPPAILDQIAGRVDFHFANAAVALPQIKAGKLRALAITSSQRSPSMPDIPTMVEAGVPGFEASQWIGVLAPHGTPQPIVDRIAKAVHQAIASPDVKVTLGKQGMDVVDPDTPAAFAAFVKADIAKWQDVVSKAHIHVD